MHEGPRELRSPAERSLLDFLAAHALPLPLTNHPVATSDGTLTVDAYWPRAGLVVEMDGLDAHATRRAVREDRRRDALLRTLGIDTIRLTSELLGPVTAQHLRSRLAAGCAQVPDPSR